MAKEKEKLCLKWNDFQENATSAFEAMREDSNFADVTLVCEDGQQIEAHKVILASSSPFFLNLLRVSLHPRPLIYMRGLKADILVAILDFLYCGEASICQENLASFFLVAEELKLKNLTDLESENTTDNQQPQREKQSELIEHKPTFKGPGGVNEVFDENAPIEVRFEKHESETKKESLDHLEAAFNNSGMAEGEGEVSDQTSALKDLAQLSKYIVQVGNPNRCETCGEVFQHRRNLNRHMAEKHSKKVFTCQPPCNFSANRTETLTKHKGSKQCVRGLYLICVGCGENCFNEVKLKRHKMKGECFKHRCELCGNRENTKAKMAVHLLADHGLH